MPKTGKRRGTLCEGVRTPTHGATTGSETPEALLEIFLHRVLYWLCTNYGRAIDVFRKFDSDSDNLVTSEEFAVGMRLLDAPMGKEEIKQLINIIDKDNDGFISILDFDQTIREHHRTLLHKKSRKQETEGYGSAGGSAVSLSLSPSRTSSKCPRCLIGLAEPPSETLPRYVAVKVMLGPFRHFSAHPGHFEVTVTDSTTIHGLREIVQSHLENAANSIALFKEEACKQNSYLAPSMTLQQCGMEGGSKYDLTPSCLYYDFIPLINDCPILMAENY